MVHSNSNYLFLEGHNPVRSGKMLQQESDIKVSILFVRMAVRVGRKSPHGHFRPALTSEDAIAEINAKLTMLRPGSWVTVVYYCNYTQEVHQLTGQVSKVDPYWKTLEVGNVSIEFYEIYQAEPLPRGDN